MKVIVNFGEKKVVVPCGFDGEISIRELIYSAAAKYAKLSYNSGVALSGDQVQLRLNNGAVVDPDDRVCDVVDDREELFATVDSHQSIYASHATPTMNSNGELSSSVTSSNLSSSLSEHDRLMGPSSTNRHEVIVTDADLRNRSLRVKNDPYYNSQQSISRQSSSSSSSNNRMTYRPTHSTLSQNVVQRQSSNDFGEMYNISIDDKTGDKIFSIMLPKENSPLGIHVVPDTGDEQQVNGLVLQNIEADGRIKRHGILQIDDRIIEINRINIERCSFDKAQFVFRTALLEPELELKIVRSMKKPPIPPKPASFHTSTRPRSTLSEINQNNDLPLADHDPNMHSLNTRRLGKIIRITLVKGNDGLGFKLASRDNPTGVVNPIYVKTIFPKGAAIEDRRLQRGDRLLTVNGIDVTQMSLQETVGLLRETRVGDAVELCISRQHDGLVPSDLINDETLVIDPTRNEIKPQIMTFDIPLNDTSSAGLGITLKGKTSIADGQSIDLGIFIKSILTGGAASRDNRLRPNDQLLVINDSSLISITNQEAAAILHEAVRREIHPGYIKVTISRSPNTTDDEQNHPNSRRCIREIPLSLPPSSSSPLVPVCDDENELDLTTFVPPAPPVSRKPPSHQSSKADKNQFALTIEDVSNHHSSWLDATRTTDSKVQLSSPHASSKIKPAPIRRQSEQQTPDDVDNNSVNPFDRETLFRQSISEKRRLTSQPNKQAVQWKQRSFHDGRTRAERKSYPISTAASIEMLTPVIDISDDDDDDDDLRETDDDCRYSVSRRSEQLRDALPDPDSNKQRSPTTVIRSSSLESIPKIIDERDSSKHIPKHDEERRRQAKLRRRACNDSFRQAVDKSYSQNPNVDDDVSDTVTESKSNKSEKQRFRFSNLFTVKPKRKEYPVKRSLTSIPVQFQLSSHDTWPKFCPPPPASVGAWRDSTSSTVQKTLKTNM